ncbi:restriction endonuclease [uncultured Halopseudomonas sp.]|uniref:restriction endonuclease n=1 Tax=uncultured Halopseudomonas sp. TaxID=2901193 RepID=UPI0030EDAA6F|tara:strand:- start:39604 stop:40473 length:870 start_codon:yes stop_codon:yes gene_type:complete
MARKRSSSFEDVVVVLSRLPWWASLLIGVVSWWILNPVANRPVVVPAGVQMHDMSGVMLSQLWQTFAMFGRYLIPLLCVFGAIGSVFGRQRRKKLLNDVKTATQPGKTIDGLSWQQFELLIGETFRRKGYSITETGGKGADGGIDLILRKGGEKYLVQCKHWRSLKVGVPVVREFFGAMAAEGAAGGYVVTSGQFTSEAKAFASGRNIELIDGAGLKGWIAQQRTTRTATVEIKPPLVVPTMTPVANQEPVCPVCSAAMVRRLAKRGVNAGNAFWGCSRYPGCKGTVSG